MRKKERNDLGGLEFPCRWIKASSKGEQLDAKKKMRKDRPRGGRTTVDGGEREKKGGKKGAPADLSSGSKRVKVM